MPPSRQTRLAFVVERSSATTVDFSCPGIVKECVDDCCSQPGQVVSLSLHSVDVMLCRSLTFIRTGMGCD